MYTIARAGEVFGKASQVSKKIFGLADLKGSTRPDMEINR
jgi:hypothetical protein